MPKNMGWLDRWCCGIASFMNKVIRVEMINCFITILLYDKT